MDGERITQRDYEIATNPGELVPFAGPEPEPSQLRYLELGDVNDIYSKISNGDPFHLEARSGHRLHVRWYILDPERVYQKAMAYVAHRAAAKEPDRGKAAWFDSCIDAAIRSILTEDREMERAGHSPGLNEDWAHEHLARMFQIPLGLARKASVQFNDLPDLDRRAFFDLIVKGIPPEEVMAMKYGTRRELRLGVLRCLEAVGHLDGEEVDRILNYGEDQ